MTPSSPATLGTSQSVRGGLITGVNCAAFQGSGIEGVQCSLQTKKKQTYSQNDECKGEVLIEVLLPNVKMQNIVDESPHPQQNEC